MLVSTFNSYWIFCAITRSIAINFFQELNNLVVQEKVARTKQLEKRNKEVRFCCTSEYCERVLFSGWTVYLLLSIIDVGIRDKGLPGPHFLQIL